MRTLANVIWFVFGGIWLGTAAMAFGLLFCLTIIGIPIGRALFQYARLMYAPFGKVIVREVDVNPNMSKIRRSGGFVLNIIWLPFGIILFLLSIPAIILSAITIIGIPHAVVVAKASVFVMRPIGAKVLTKEEHIAAMVRNN
ncbi:MAG: hypothetical protein FWE33_04525 [Defluviitaleaceae bacterium]|nr:hypothetical protein [Defluviitaleaceae bacterium]